MLKTIIRRYPYQTFMVLYNLGVFAWLQTNATILLSNNGLDADQLFNNVPYLSNAFQFDLTSITTFFQTSPIRWLIISIIISVILNFVGKILRIIFSLIIIIVGLALMYIYAKSNGLF